MAFLAHLPNATLSRLRSRGRCSTGLPWGDAGLCTPIGKARVDDGAASLSSSDSPPELVRMNIPKVGRGVLALLAVLDWPAAALPAGGADGEGDTGSSIGAARRATPITTSSVSCDVWETREAREGRMDREAVIPVAVSCGPSAAAGGWFWNRDAALLRRCCLA